MSGPTALLTVDVTLRRHTWRLHTGASRVGLVGPSGAGKTTVLRVLAGLERGAEGHVAFAGRTWQAPGAPFVPPWRRRIGWVPQDPTLFPHRTVRDNLGWAGAGAGAIAEMAARLGIGPLLDRMPRHLSGGERQRVAIGRALLADPDLLLLDEPFSALDAELRREVVGVVRAWCDERGAALVLVSHDDRDVAALAREVWTMGGGILRRERAA